MANWVPIPKHLTVAPADFGADLRYVREHVTPHAFEVERLYPEATKGLTTTREAAEACWRCVRDNVAAAPYVKATLSLAEVSTAGETTDRCGLLERQLLDASIHDHQGEKRATARVGPSC